MLMSIVKNKRFIYVTSCGCMKLFLYHKNYTPRKSSALQWRWGLCDPTTIRAILAEASASSRSYQAREVKGQDPDKQMIELLAAGQGSAHRQIQLVVFWLRVTAVLGRILQLLVGVGSINSQINNRKKISEEIRPVSK